MIMKNGRVLLSERKGAHGAGEYAFPGGHLEFGESFEECCRRETSEECGIRIKNIRFLYVTNLTHYPGKHYAHIGMIADWASGEPKVLEPEKAGSWDWYSLDKLPPKMFEACKLSLESYKTGKVYFN